MKSISLPKRVGIIGGGQLGQMLSLAARQIGVEPVILAHRPSDCALAVSKEHFMDDGSDASVEAFLNSVEIVTIENEFLDLDRYEKILKKYPEKQFFPTIETLRFAQSKLEQKVFFKKNGIPTLEFLTINDQDGFEPAYLHFDGRVVFKEARLGYDGRGTFLFRGKKDKIKLQNLINRPGKAFFGYSEPLVDFKKEFAVVIARSSIGEIKSYFPVETHQKNGICHWAFAPASLSPKQNKEALAIAKQVVQKLKAVGIFAVELFLLKNGKIVVNEIAPRVHNSGHLTQNACLTSQFEQHLRAILGFELGSTELIKPAAMVNIIGTTEQTLPTAVPTSLPQTNIWTHWYGKIGFTKDRKLGHINAVGKSVKEALTRAQAARKRVLV